MGIPFRPMRLVPGRTIIPSGTVWEFAGATVPAGWLLCDGTSHATATYPALFAAIGYTYGGAGANFNVPDCRGRGTIGVGSVNTNQQPSAVLGATGGDITNLVTHTHTQNAHNHTGTAANESAHTHPIPDYVAGPPGSTWQWAGQGSTFTFNSGAGTAHTHAITVGNTTATNNNNGSGTTARQPFIALNKIIKT